ncbi:D-glycerate dehydrogenase [Bacillus timonensis]|nr:D-glycerate dehydrogenase [Bacillus timonensis]
MKKLVVYVTRKLPDDSIQRLKSQFEVKMWPMENEAIPRDVLLEEVQKADALITMLSDQIDRQILNHASNVKVIANLAVGFDNIDVHYATEKGIAICNTPDVLTDTTADLTFGLLMATARRIVEADQYIKKGQWRGWSPLLLAGQDIHHKTIGIVGMGKIGEVVAKRATGFDMEILYHNRSRNMNAEIKLGAQYCSFEELISTSDFVVCLTPLTSQTKELFNKAVFKQMKRSAIFINAARGAVVNEADLYEALLSGEIAGAGLDVFEVEPIGAEHPLLTLPNVVALPHIGSSSFDTRMNMIDLCCRNIMHVLTGEAPETIVNKEWLLKHMKHL